MFKKTSTLFSALLIGACLISPSLSQASADDAIMKAESALKEAQAVGGVWRVIDKATGSTAVPLTKLLAAAKKKAEAGEADEAARIAGLVEKYSMIGVEQVKSEMNAGPKY